MVDWLNGDVGSEGRCDSVFQMLGQPAEKSVEVTFR